MILCRSPIEDGEAPAASSSSGGFPRFHDFQRLLPHSRFHTYAKLCLWLSPSSPQRGGTDTWGNEVSSWDAFSLIASALSHHYFRSLESERQFRAWLCGWNGRCNAALFVCFCQWIRLSLLWCTLPAPYCFRQGIVCCVWYRVFFSTAASTPT